jgi:flagellar biosynthesis regulator FlaF
MKTHISGHRREIAQAKIKGKITVLERYVAKGAPEGAFIPKDLTSFRLWEDTPLGLEKIGSPNTLDKPYNETLKNQALELITQLRKNKKWSDNPAGIINRLRKQVKRLSRLVRELASQLHSTRQDLDQARQSERRWKKRVEELNEENAELRRKLSTVISLRSVSGGAGEPQYAP